MSYDRLYKPQPCSPWPAAHLRAVGITYREAAGQGLDGTACLERAVVAYVAAGGARQGSAKTVLDVIASLSVEKGATGSGTQRRPCAIGSHAPASSRTCLSRLKRGAPC